MTLLDELNALTTHRHPEDGQDCIRANDLRRVIARNTPTAPATAKDGVCLVCGGAVLNSGDHIEPKRHSAFVEDEREALREQMHTGYKALLDSGTSMDEVSWTDYLLDQAIAAKRATAPEKEELSFGWDGTWRTQGQDAEEGRRVLMTWTKKQLVDGYIQMWQSDIQRESFGVSLLKGQVNALRERLAKEFFAGTWLAPLTGREREEVAVADGEPTDNPAATENERDGLVRLQLASVTFIASDGYPSTGFRTNEEAADIAFTAGYRLHPMASAEDAAAPKTEWSA